MTRHVVAAAALILSGGIALSACTVPGRVPDAPGVSATGSAPATTSVTTTPPREGPGVVPTAARPPTSGGRSSTNPSPSSRASTAPRVLPRGLAGTWTSLDQGSAEAMYELLDDGTYRRARVLMQSRASGTFSFTIGDVGTIRVSGATVTVTPSEGTTSLKDPDSPSSNYENRPLTDLTPERYTYSLSGDRLTLTDGNGAVSYQRERP